MIFNEMNNSIYYDGIQESPHDLGIGGALMHVYENECNYNALMKAAALSEMKYYNQTGNNLFVQEAGALSGFLGKVKEFFKKVIEKIKSIAKKFIAKINQYAIDDKDFVKKYQNDLVRRDLTDFEFNGYKFPAWKGNTDIKNFKTFKGSDYANYDAINDIIERHRGRIVGGSAMTESEYRDELKEKLYGDKDDIKVNIREQLNIISDTAKLVKEAEKEEKEIIKNINDMIKSFDKDIDTVDKAIKNNTPLQYDEEDNEERENYIKNDNVMIAVYKALSNDLTVYFGAYVKSLIDRNRQAKAICVKALSYKHEAATLEGGYNDIFAGVEIV